MILFKKGIMVHWNDEHGSHIESLNVEGDGFWEKTKECSVVCDCALMACS